MVKPLRWKDPNRLKVILLTVLINITAVIFFSTTNWSDWKTGLFLNLVDNGILLFYWYKTRDPLMPHLLIFGIAVGLAELPADAWLVDYTKTLDYSIGGGPIIWRSPLWMPFAWEIVAVQFGYIGWVLYDRFKIGGILLAAVLGAINIPFYEEMALKTHWWLYRGCKMFLHTPYYIILGEFLIVICLVYGTKNIHRLRWDKTVLTGIVAGLSIFVCYAIAFYLIERI